MPHELPPIDAITAALAQVRGRRGPRPPWTDGGGKPWGHGPHHGHHGFGPPWMGADRGRFGGPARLRALEALAAASGPLTVGEIAAAIGVDQPRASRLVQQGVEMGMLRREADPDDARRTRVALTDQGVAIARRFRGERRDLVQAALASFTEDEQRELARLLAKLAASWPSD